MNYLSLFMTPLSQVYRMVMFIYVVGFSTT